MNAVGIDISKGKSVAAIVQLGGQVISKPFELLHTPDDLAQLVALIHSLPGESRIVMEYTGHYYQPVARYLQEAGLYVTVIHPLLVCRYSHNSIRAGKTDRKDALKIANYALDRWASLIPFMPDDKARQLLRTLCRQYNQYQKLRTSLKNNLTALTDQTYPGINTLFTSPPRKNGHEKSSDFVAEFWHCKCVTQLTLVEFIQKYNDWCKKLGYHPSCKKAEKIYIFSQKLLSTLPHDEGVRRLIQQAVIQINAINETIASTLQQMQRLAEQLPEYPEVISLHGVGYVLAPQLIAEIGDVRRFTGKAALVAYAGVDSPPHQSGSMNLSSCRISKRGSPNLRRILYQIMISLMQHHPEDDAVYSFINKKRSEGKHFYVCMVAGMNKFLRIYYARLRDFLETGEPTDS